MSEQYICPKCKSGRVVIGYPNITCLDCLYSEPLIDYPISYSYHRSMCLEYGKPIPPTLESDTKPPVIQVPIKQREADQLNARLNYLTNKVNEHIDKSKKKQGDKL